MSDIDKANLETGFRNQIDWNKVRNITAQVIPAVVTLQNNSKNPLGIFYLDRDALLKTCSTRKLSLYSTSRGKSWTKGEESGNTFTVVEVRINCEQNSLHIIVVQDNAGICHVKDANNSPHGSCFYRSVDLNDPENIYFPD